MEITWNGELGSRLKKHLLPFSLGLIVGMCVLWVVFEIVGPRTDQPDDPTIQSSSEVGPSDGQESDEATPTPPERPVYPYGIRGALADQSGRVLAGGQVVARNEDGEEVARASSDRNGEFYLESLPMGLYDIEGYATGFQAAYRAGVVPDGPPTELRLTAVEGQSAQILFGDTPVAGATVSVGGPGLHPPLQTQTDSFGRFSISELSSWAGVEIFSSAEGVSTGFHVFMGAEGDQVLEARSAPPMTVLVTVPGGQSASEGVVYLARAPLHVLRIGTELDAGTARFASVPDGAVYISVEVPGFLIWRGEVTHSGEPITVELSAGSTASGQVRDEDGAPVQGARIIATSRDVTGRRFQIGRAYQAGIDTLWGPDGTMIVPPEYAVHTDHEGRFHLGGIPAGSVRITASKDGYESESSSRRDVSASEQIIDLALVLERD